MKKTIAKKLLTVIVLGFFIVIALFTARPTQAIWSNVASDWARDWVKTFVHEEIHNIIPDVAKRIAMERFQKFVYKKVAKSGGFIFNYGEYLYGSGNSAMAKYWRAFLTNCTNIDPRVSLNIQFQDVEQKKYDWCPVRVNVRGVDLQAKIDLGKNFGWDDFSDFMAANTYEQYYKLKDQVQDSKDKQELVKFMEAISPGTKAKTEEVTPQTDGTTGDNTAANPENQTKERVKVPVQAFLNMLNTATGGVVQVTANQRSIVASAISYMALNALADWTLDKVPYGEYFK